VPRKTSTERLEWRKLLDEWGGIPPGHKTKYGWLVDDGGPPDMIAVKLAVDGARLPEVPNLTHQEAKLVAQALRDQANERRIDGSPDTCTMAANELIQHRLKISKTRAKSLMSELRDMEMRERRREFADV
jgi:hypothetical protein